MESGKVMMLILAAVGIMVGLVLLPVIANQLYPVSNTITYSNQSVKPAAIGNVSVQLEGQNFEGTPAVKNATDTITNQFTIYQAQGSDQLYHVYMKTLDTATFAGNNKTNLRVDYISEPVGYADSATRSIAPLIVLFFVLAIVFIGLWPTVRDWF